MHFDLGIQFLGVMFLTIGFIYIGQIFVSSFIPKDRISLNTIFNISNAKFNRQILQNDKAANNYRENLELTVSAITIAGIFMTVISIHTRNHQDKLTQASLFAEQWYSPEMEESNQNIRGYVGIQFEKIFQEIDINLQSKGSTEILLCLRNCKSITLAEIQMDIYTYLKHEQNNDLKNHLTKELTFFEKMGHDIDFGVADEKYLKGLFLSIVIRDYVFFDLHLKGIRQKHGSFAYCNFIKLANRWANQFPFDCSAIKQDFLLDSNREDVIELESNKGEDTT
jgi:hypothetical protein